MSSWRKMARHAALSLGLIAGLALLGYRRLIRDPLPQEQGEIWSGDLDHDVQIRRDSWGIPHIYAETAHDLFYAQGYVHAQDRLWQMEFNRRSASGRLAEILGEKALPIDGFTRRLGLRRVAEVELGASDAEWQEVLRAYCAGINHFQDTCRQPPVEFTLLRLNPEPWTPVDVLSFTRLVGWLLSSNWDTELIRARLIEGIGPEGVAEIEPEYLAGQPLSAEPGVGSPNLPGFGIVELEDAAGLLRYASGAGSNAWAVAGQLSSTGKPLLATDPHLSPQIPSQWYQIHLCGGGFDVAGASMPGLPLVTIGHNGRVAWGATMSYVDVQDLYLERLHPSDRHRYRYQGNWEEAIVVREEIRVRGCSTPVVEDVLITRHGPIVSSGLPGERRAMALRSPSLDPEPFSQAVVQMTRATSGEEFREALRNWGVSTLNFVYADTSGTIGYQLAGRVPIRSATAGVAPVAGWTGQNEWLGYVPFDELPSVQNPTVHYVVNANNAPGGNCPYPLGREWIAGFRAQRIVDLLVSQKQHSPADFQRYQSDVLSLAARAIVASLGDLRPEDEWTGRVLQLLRDWDCRVSAESASAAFYEVLRLCLLRNVFRGKARGMLDTYLGDGVHPLLSKSGYRGRVISRLVQLLRYRPPQWFPGDASAGSAERGWEIALQGCLREAVSVLRATLGDDIVRWRWGDLHGISFEHILGGTWPLRPILSRGPYPVGGDGETISQTGMGSLDLSMSAVIAPSYRMIVDLADPDNSVAVLPTGQSGHPGSCHYSDMTQLWLRGEYHPLPFSRKAVKRHARKTLLMRSVSGLGSQSPT